MNRPLSCACLLNSRGVTLVELMIAVAIISVGILASIASFQYISTAIERSKSRSLANNLAQEKIEQLKNLSYYMLLVTTATTTDNYGLGLLYDTGNYPPETSLAVGGITFQRTTRVDFVYQNGNSLSAASSSSNDTGLKQITVDVLWHEGSTWKYIELHNLMSNPAMQPLNATFSGQVTKAGTTTPIAGALVQTLENSAYFTTTDNSGNYSFNVSPGSYTLKCSSTGYFSSVSYNKQATSNNSTTVPFSLSSMSSGTVQGYVYTNTHLLISQVVASTGTTGDIEYVELYNPTTSSILIGSTATVNSPNIWPILWGSDNNYNERHLCYMNSYVPSYGYYLISNTGNGNPANTCNSFMINSITITPDACWLHVPYPAHAISCGTASNCASNNSSFVQGAGGVSIANSSGWTASWPATRIDSVGWSKNNSSNSAPPGATEPTANGGIASNAGLGPNEAFIRWAYPGNVVATATNGRAYDTDTNSNDFYDLTSIWTPYTSGVTGTPLIGTAVVGAFVNLNDPLSSLVTTDASGFFSIPGVATGTWTLIIDSGTLYTEIDTVTVTANATISVPNATTVPIWPASGYNNTLLNNTTTYALIAGTVYDAMGNPLNGIAISGGIYPANTSPQGRFFVSASTGNVSLTANLNNANPSYMSQSITISNATAGYLDDNNNFYLSQVGRVKGYVQTAANTALPSIAVVAFDAGGTEVSGVATDYTGYFYLPNLSTGTYTIEPQVDPAESVSPTSQSITLTSVGNTVFAGTFTVTNALATITGSVTSNGQAITTGVLVIASTVTLAGGASTAPPSLSGATGPLCAPCYYTGSSEATGTYSIEVRSSTSTTYNVYGWYTTLNGNSVSYSRNGPYSVLVSTGGGTVTQNITW